MTREARLGVVFLLNTVLIVALVSVGIAAHSLGVLAAGGDYLADALAIALSVFTVRLTHRAPTEKRSFGFHRTTILAAQVNASMIVAVTAVVCFEAVTRLAGDTPEVRGLPVVIVSAIAAVVMLAGTLVLRGDGSDDDLNMRSVLLDTAADAATAASIAVTGGIILVSRRFFWLDPVVALLVALIIGHRALRLLRDVSDVLLESTPKGIDVAEVAAVLTLGGEISEVHDLHVWSLSSDVPVLSAHVVLAGHPTLEEAQVVAERAKDRLLARFGIDHATLETECERCAVPDPHLPRARS